MQKRNDNYFGFEILCHLNKKQLWKLAEKNRLYLYLFLYCFLSFPKSLKVPSGLTKLCNFVNKDYDYDYCNLIKKAKPKI